MSVEIANLLNPDAVPFLPPLDTAVVETVDAVSLLTPQRFDLVAKTIYARAVRSGYGMAWARGIYEEHLRVFNGLVEGDVSGKSCLQDYESAFQAVIADMERHGFDASRSVIPVGKNLVLFDGAHRAAAAIAVGCSVSVARFNANGPLYDAMYFHRRGLSLATMDAMAVEYCRQKHACRIILVLSAKPIQKRVKNLSAAVYQKSPCLNEKGVPNLIRLIGSDAERLGATERGSFPKGVVMAYLVDTQSAGDDVRIKEQVKAAFSDGDAVVYMSRTEDETLRWAEMVYHQGSVWALNHALLNLDGAFRKRVDAYLANEDVERCCMGVDALLALFGAEGTDPVDWCHEERTCSDPTRHFYVNGAKIIMPRSALELYPETDGEARNLLESLAACEIEGTNAELKQKRRKLFYCRLLRVRRILHVDQTYRTALSVWNRFTRR